MSQKFFKFTSESLSASYIPFPRFLMEDSLAGLSNDAKVLYALMLDRASISKVNGFLETDGTIRIYFTVEQAQKKLHRSRQCATRIFHELEFSGLICRKKQGQARPHHAELPSGRKANSAKRGWRNIARIKVENKVFSAPQALRKHRGISFPITPQKSVSMRLQKR